ncbi:MAG: diguanylate cyclase [Methylococcaceae bacterium]|jgi:diguanylate cyclase
MAAQISFLPVYEGSLEEHRHYLKQSLFLMGKYNIAMHPINYAIFYDYAIGHNPSLIHDVDTLIANKQRFDYGISLNLFKTHICNSTVECFENINSELNRLISGISVSVSQTSEKTTLATQNFTATSQSLKQLDDPQKLQLLLSNMVLETQQLTETSKQLKSELEQAQKEMDQLKNELTHIRTVAKTDALTGLLNRGAFEEAMSELLEETDSCSANQTCLAILDIDNFKRINDKFGHLVGDKVLKFFGSLLKKNALKNHIIARYGGEEIIMLMPETSLGEALNLTEHIRKLLETSQLKRTDKAESIGKVTVSVGITKLKAGDTTESFIGRADQALYQAKNNGRNQVVIDNFFEPQTTQP